MAQEREARTLPESIPQGDADAAARWASTVAQFFDTPAAHTFFRAGAEVADVRRISIQVRDRLKRDWGGRWLLLVWLSTAEDGTPAGAQTITWVTGSVLSALVANRAYLIETDEGGAASFDAEVVGAGTRYPNGVVLGPARGGAAVTWAV